LRASAGKSGDSLNDLRDFLAHLILHEQAHHSDYSRNDHTPLDAHLVLHYIPRQSGDRRRCIPRRRRLARLLLGGSDGLAPAPVAIVVAIRRVPSAISAAMPLALTLLALARVLSIAYSRVR